MKRLKKELKTSVILFAISLLLTACASNVNVEVTTDGQPTKQEETTAPILDNNENNEANNQTTAQEADVSDSSDDDESREVKFSYRFADREEGVSLLLGNTEYYNNLNQNDMDYRAQKKGATLEEVQAYAAEQVLEFSEEDKNIIDESIRTIESILNENGYVLPETDEIVFVKTTQLEEGAAAYTHKTEIYLGDDLLEFIHSDDEAMQRMGNSVMCHEIFHCLTRNNPQFREAMYSFIHFTVQDKDFELGQEIHELAYSNPDVDHRNSYATFTINGEEKDCFIVLMVNPFEKEGEEFVNFSENLIISLVPVDDTDTYYSIFENKEIHEAYFDVVGKNTGYVIDPEECMADNFSYAIIYGKDGIEGEPYETPEIIDNIIDYLKK